MSHLGKRYCLVEEEQEQAQKRRREEAVYVTLTHALLPINDVTPEHERVAAMFLDKVSGVAMSRLCHAACAKHTKAQYFILYRPSACVCCRNEHKGDKYSILVDNGSHSAPLAENNLGDSVMAMPGVYSINGLCFHCAYRVQMIYDIVNLHGHLILSLMLGSTVFGVSDLIMKYSRFCEKHACVFCQQLCIRH
jgi:hypothetical protein